MTTSIATPEILQFPFPNGSPHYGCDQDWYRGFWQRKAGCGPCTGSNLLYYFARCGRLKLPMEVKDQEGFIRLMEHSWGYLTPGVMGLNSPFLMQEGMDRMLSQLGSRGSSRVMEIPADEGKRPALAAVEAFIREGLNANSPVAFLNLSNGEVRNLENWHWVTVVGLSGSGNDAVMDIYDNGHRLQVSLPLWLSTTRRGGGFVYVTGEEPPV